MKFSKIKFISTVLILILSACCKKDNTTNPFGDDPNITTVAGTWKVLSYDDLVSNTQITKNSTNTWLNVNNGDEMVTFKDTTNEGIISGVAVTNQVSGSYTITSPRNIKIHSLFTTKINQPEWADLFGENIIKAETFSVNNMRLKIFYNSKKNSITFERQ